MQQHEAEANALHQKVLNLQSEAARMWSVVSTRDVGERTSNFAKHIGIECRGVEEDMDGKRSEQSLRLSLRSHF